MSGEQPFTWTIRDFLDIDIAASGEFLNSPIFASNNGEQTWRLKLYPKGSTDELRDYVSIFVQLISCRGHQEVRAKFVFALLTDSGEEVMVTSSKASNFTLLSVYGFNRFVNRRSLRRAQKSLVPDGRLVVQCRLSCKNEFGSLSPSAEADDGLSLSRPLIDQPLGQSTVSRLIEDLSILLSEDDYSDISLRVNEQVFPVHRSILATRSPYFKAFFYHKASRHHHNRPLVLDVPFNIEPEVFAETLRFIYTGRCGERARTMARNLLISADNFGLEDLKDLCARYLRDSLSVDNAVEMAMFATQHRSTWLKARVIEFIRENLVNEKATDIVRNLTNYLERFDGFA